MLNVEMLDEGMKSLSNYIKNKLIVEAIFARSEKEEMIGLYTTKELISPNTEFVLSGISKKYNEKNYEVQLINMKGNENKFKECYFDNIEEVKELLTIFREMVKKEEEFKLKIVELVNKQQ